MVGHAYAIANGKGGVGKTTVAINLWAALHADGIAVALIDADLRMADVGDILELDADTTLHDVLAGRTLGLDAVAEYDEDAGVVPGRTDIGAAADVDARRLEVVIESLKDRFDVVLVDTGAGLGHEDVLALGLVDEVIIVTTPDEPAIRAARKTSAAIGGIGGRVAGAIVNRVRDGDDPPRVAERLDTGLLGAVPESDAISGPGATPGPLVRDAPDTRASGAFEAIAGWVETRLHTRSRTTEHHGDIETHRENASLSVAAEARTPPAAEGEATDQPASGLRGWLARLFG